MKKNRKLEMVSGFLGKPLSNVLSICLMLLCMMCAISCNDDPEDEPNNMKTTLSAPTNVTAVQKGDAIMVSWNYVSNAARYIVYARQGSNATTSSFSASDTYVTYTPERKTSGYCYFKVKAVAYDGTESSYSTEVACMYKPGSSGGNDDVLSAPTGVSAVKEGSSIKISWNTVSAATSYNVYRSSSSGGTFSKLGSATNTLYTDNSPLSGYNYYKVTAVKGSQESDKSVVASVNYSSGSGGGTTTKPSAPTGVRVDNEGNSLVPMITIRWNDVSDATSYNVYRSTSQYGSYSKMGTTTVTAKVDDNPREGTTYYKVTAVNSAGESGYSAVVSYTYKANDVAPCPVQYGNCTATSTTITMRWTVPTQSGCGKPTKAYLKVKHPDNDEYVVLETLSPTATTASFNFLPWINTGKYNSGYVYVGIITENDKGTSGGVPKVYDTKNKKWF